jgi:radical SAM superfamily enzyme YgiQ (UPF0313 family)
MPHLALAPLTGLRVRSEKVQELGMTLPGMRRRADALSEIPALGLLTLAGLTPPHWSMSYHDAARWNEELVEQIAATQPTLVAISALTASILEAYAFSAALRARKILTVIGGLHATVRPEEAVQHCDAVVIGEGEPVWQTLLADAELGNLKRTYRAEKLFDFAIAPRPRFDLIAAKPNRRWTIQTERGCPFACEFCGASRLLGGFREKPVEKIRAELAAISALEDDIWLELADDNTFAGARSAPELLQAIGETNVRYFTEVDWRIGERPEVLKHLAASGCVQVLLGIESLVFRYPGMGAKQAELHRIMDAVAAIQETGVVVNGCFIVGAEGETDASLDRLAEFILASSLAEVQLTLQTPFPGTGLNRKLKSENRLVKERDWSYYTLFDVTYIPDQMSVDALEQGFERVVRAVFSPTASARRSELRKSIWRRNPKFGKLTA